jgi:hypothetical protein
MPIEHLVCLKLRKPLPKQQLNALYAECQARFDKIPGIVTSSMGANWHTEPLGYTHAIVIRFADRNSLDVFMTHPEHTAAGRLLQKAFSEFLVLDYETERP